MVVLADVKELPSAFGSRLAEFVVRGGGLLILPGEQASVSFYNDWMVTLNEEPSRLLPATLGSQARPSVGGIPYLDPSTLVYATLQPLRDARRNDLDSSRVRRYWQLAPDANGQPMTAGRLSNGFPWLVERTVGRGRVLLAATSLDTRDGNLPTLQAFLPLVYGLVYHLAEDTRWELNHPPGRVVLHFPAERLSPAAPSTEANFPAEITAPDGVRVHVLGRSEGEAITVTADHLFMPGLYRIAWSARGRAGRRRGGQAGPFYGDQQSRRVLLGTALGP